MLVITMKTLNFCLLLGLFIALAESKTVKVTKIQTQGGKRESAILSREYNEEKNAPEKEDIFEINKDLSLIDGDIIPPKERSTIKNRLWDTIVIPVTYNSGLSLEAIGSIEYARIEYELRTCLSLVDRSNERNYIDFNTLSGCYSSVGQVGGGQTISIGNGCERIGTVIHEIMHAIGIYHEQSRTDRNDYVQIEFDNIDSGKENNFNTYSYLTVDDRRVPYDYNSVMHYSDTSFSNNGLPTIVTNDPTYQDVIGQRRAFSVGDTTKINRMYQCADTVRYSYNCDFEDPTVCGYVQEDGNQADWSRYQTSSAAQPENYPATDSTFNEAGGSYMLFDTEQVKVSGAFDTMRMKTKSSSQCLEFSYHMNLVEGSSTTLNVYVAKLDSSTGDILERGSPVTTLTGNQIDDWNIERLTISADPTYKLVFELIKDQARDTVAIDDLNVVDKPCETGYFVIRDYSQLIATAQKGDYIYSPLMYTDDGYAFQIKFYPVGSTSASTGYMSMFYSVAKGVNDDTLSWPFSDRFIRLSVVDQDPEAVNRMSQSNNFMTDDSSAYQKPTSTRNGGYGYSSFMTYSDIVNTRSFLKHDSVVISVEVKDMSSFALKQNTAKLTASLMKAPGNETMEDQDEATKEFGYSPVSAVSIVGISAACTFLLMIIVMFIVNEKNSKQLNKAMLSSTN